MVEHAKRNFAHPRICYDVLDIGGNGVADFVGRYGHFDRVYSFFCLHWIGDQETAFKNIVDLMKPGGECLLYFNASSSFMRLGRKLLSLDHWKKYRKMVHVTHPPTLDLADRDASLSYLSGLVKNANLGPTTCEVIEDYPRWSSVEEYTRVHMGVIRLADLVTEDENPLLLKDVAEEGAKLLAEREAGGSPFRNSKFLVRAHKPRY
ncbi:juvenile hormone acid O-methyltransferase-like [Ixodes scapularis]|uniref:juvenile hormone acid O-methyltransferase-like n=1 Tax=Ixodes scapularis TaxID=6945 RepID=UPI001A9DD8F6|nr:juvenile hormone acid O-methyltransferase-like [Ixodes scapularis]